MHSFLVTVAIATFNRKELLGRAIESVLTQHWPDVEILVVDDASVDGTAEFVARHYPRVRYFGQDTNRGCGEARNRALKEATRPYVLILDDDDTLLPGSLSLIAARMAEFRDLYKYPVVNFARGNAALCAPFVLARMEDYITGAICGDFVPVIRRELFLRENLRYPLSRVGGEHMLWWKIAQRYGIPTWADKVGSVNSDASVRLTGTRSQILHAQEHAELQERTLEEFAALLAQQFPAYCEKKRLGAAAYRLLAGNRLEARSHLRAAFRRRPSGAAAVLWALSFAPAFLVWQSFAAYRRISGVHG